MAKSNNCSNNVNSRNAKEDVKMATNNNRNRRSNRSRGNNTHRDYNRGANVGDTTKVSKDINDASYYFDSPEMMHQLCNISFNEFLGTSFEVGNASFIEKIPTIITIPCMPSVGFTSLEDPKSAGVNRAARALFLQMSANNAKSTSYGPEDVILALVGVGQLIAIDGWIKRIFGSMMIYNPRNKSVPKVLVESNGIDYNDLSNNYSTYRTRYNQLVVLANAIPFMANFSYFKKCAEYYSNYYYDMPTTEMACITQFVPQYTWEFDDVYSPQGSGLKTIQLYDRANKKTLGTILDAFASMISALSGSTALLKVYSDVLRLHKLNNFPLVTFQQIPDSYAVLPMYKPELTMIIHNLITTGDIPMATPQNASYTKSNDVVGDATIAGIIYRPQFNRAQGKTLLPDASLIDFPMTPTDADIAEATRMKFCEVDSFIDGIYYTEKFTCGDLIPISFIVYKGIDDTPVSVGSICAINNYTAQQLAAWVDDLTKWHEAPLVYCINENTTGDKLDGIIGDLTYFTTVDFSYLDKVNDYTFQCIFRWQD